MKLATARSSIAFSAGKSISLCEKSFLDLSKVCINALELTSEERWRNLQNLEDFAEWKRKQLVCVYVCVRERESVCVRVSMCGCSHVFVCVRVCIYICKQMYIQIHSSNTTSNERGGCMIESSQQKRGSGAGRRGSVQFVPVACISSPLRSFKKNSTPNLHPSAASSSAQYVSYTQG